MLCELFNGEINPSKRVMNQNAKISEKKQVYLDELDAFHAKLDAALDDDFDQLLSKYAAYRDAKEEHAFALGFGLAFGFMLESVRMWKMAE